MRTAIRVARCAALSLYGFATLAAAQPAPQLEVDFTSATIPLSPVLSVLIAVVIAACGLYALRRSRGAGRLVSWLVVASAALPLTHALTHTQWISEARAVPFIELPLTTSPATIAVTGSGGVYRATNSTGTNVSLIAIKLNNPSGYIIYAPNTTCTPGASLAPGGSCLIDVEAPS